MLTLWRHIVFLISLKKMLLILYKGLTMRVYSFKWMIENEISMEKFSVKNSLGILILVKPKSEHQN